MRFGLVAKDEAKLKCIKFSSKSRGRLPASNALTEKQLKKKLKFYNLFARLGSMQFILRHNRAYDVLNSHLE